MRQPTPDFSELAPMLDLAHESLADLVGSEWSELRTWVRERLEVVPSLDAHELARELRVPHEAIPAFLALLPFLDPAEIALTRGKLSRRRNLEPDEARKAALDLLADPQVRLGCDSVVALLRGRPQRKLERYRERPAYGILKHWDARSLRGVLDELVAAGELELTRILLWGREGRVLTRREA